MYYFRRCKPKSITISNNIQKLTVMGARDWRSRLTPQAPPTYRIGNRILRINYHVALLLVGICLLFVLFFYMNTKYSYNTTHSDKAWSDSHSSPSSFNSNTHRNLNSDETAYNATYPLTSPIVTRGGVITYRIAMVADLDHNAKVVKNDGSIVFHSYLKKGYLSHVHAKDEIRITWDVDEPKTLESAFALKGRGMELSELITFNGELLTFDDRTGLVYKLVNEKPIPWIILLDGNGLNTKGFKCEWATVKQQKLYVGSMGKEWTTNAGEFESLDPMYVKVITPTGEVRHLDWTDNYKLLRKTAMQVDFPGYMIHESAVWSELNKKWYFLPRRCSTERYNDTVDEHMGCNLLITTDEDFTKIETVTLDIANTAPTHGFSSFKFIPGTDDRIILAIKSEELNGKTATFITAFDIAGKTLLPEQKIETDLKYEGLEFI